MQESACVRRAGRAPSAAWPSAVLAAGVPAGTKYLQNHVLRIVNNSSYKS